MRHTAHLILFCFALPAGSPASAQTTVSLTGGINFASVATETGLAANYGGAKRLFAGVGANFPVAGPLQIQFGAAFSQKGNYYWLSGVSGLDGFAEIPALDIQLRMGYLEFNVLGRLASQVSGGPIALHLLAGPAMAFLASCEATATVYEDDRPRESITSTCPDEAEVTGLDLGLAAGTGVDVELTDRIGVTAGLLYTHGLRDSGEIWVGSNPRDLNRERELTARHRVLTLNVGFTYSIR